MSKMSRWLQPPPKDSLEQQYQDLANQLRAKERALETTSHDLKVKTAAMQVLEQKIMSSETQFSSAQRELTARSEQLKTLEAELAVRSTRLTDLEAEGVAARQRVSELNSTITALVNELRGAQQACQAAEHTQEVLKEEIRVLREHIAQLNDGLADRDHLRARLEQLEAVQGRVHQLEVELSDREAAHRGALQQSESAIAERDRRIEELIPLTHLLREKGAEIKEWDKKYARTVQEHKTETAKLQAQCAAQEQLREQLLLHEQQLHERDEQIAGFHRQLQDLHAERQKLLQEVQSIPGKDEQIDRLHKRLRELRSAQRANIAPATVEPRRPRQNGAESNAQVRQSKAGKNVPEDDLKKIYGIGPVFADTLNKMGTRTFIQIARWKPEDIEKIAKKLDADPERIKRENWIADAKKQHYRKYGERV